MQECRISTSVTPLLSSPDANSVCTSEALYGERITVLEELGQWVLARQHHDQYEGYLQRSALSAIDSSPVDFPTSTHWVSQRSTLLFKQADLKSPISHRIPFAAELSLTPVAQTAFSKTACGYFVWSDHCLSMNDNHSSDPLTLAQSHFLGMPYRWGGRSPEGADCSGLIQLLARSQGYSIPRDSSEQEAHINSIVTTGNYQALDVIYWPGHTGLLIDAVSILHSTAHTLSCVIEPIQDVVSRAGKPSSVRRLFK